MGQSATDEHKHDESSEHSHDEHSHEGEDDHSHDGGHDHEHLHDHGSGITGFFNSLFDRHTHSHTALAADRSFSSSEEGIRTVWIALALLGITTVLQIVISIISGSVALLADTVHNLGDALNSIPLLIAFYLARRVASRRYNYGFGRAEDIAGIFIVLSIAFSAGYIFYESFTKLLNPEPLRNIGWVAAASIIGFLGNEAVALLQIRVGRKIDSAALIADGLHARTDGLTSLAVLVAAGGAYLGFPLADPIVGMLIGVAILFITRDAAVSMWYRLMDSVDPQLLDTAEAAVATVAEVKECQRVRMRWVGHQLHSEVTIAVEPEITTAKSHDIAEDVRHAVFHAIDSVYEVIVHVEPYSDDQSHVHEKTAHHEAPPAPLIN